jgi:adenylate cyclase class 2
MREIEIKAKVSNKQALIDKITQSGIQLSDPIKQHDVVYGQKDVADNAPGSIWLRIRTENDTKIIFTLKQSHQGGLDSIEHETEVSDSEELASIILRLGFTLYSDLIKTRQKAKFNDIEICVDDVEGLGVFIEAEQLANEDADGELIAKNLWSELEKFGVDRSDEVFEGYDVLMNKKSKSNTALKHSLINPVLS